MFFIGFNLSPKILKENPNKNAPSFRLNGQTLGAFFLLYQGFYRILYSRFLSSRFRLYTINPPTATNNGANTTATIVISLINILIEGPEVSLKGSPTVSPTTAALWASEPFPPC